MLIIDTSTEKSFIATEEETYFFPAEERESIHIVSVVKKLLNGKKPDWIGVGLGPGAFTGTRVGVIVAKMLAFAYGVPLIGFCSLIAYRAKTPYTVAFDAKARGAYLLDSEGAEPYLGEPRYPAISPHPESLRHIEATAAEPDIAFLRSHLPQIAPSTPETLTAMYLGSI